MTKNPAQHRPAPRPEKKNKPATPVPPPSPAVEAAVDAAIEAAVDAAATAIASAESTMTVETPVAAADPTPNKPGPWPSKGRLPHGSRFDVGYDDTLKQWKGTLTVPRPAGDPKLGTEPLKVFHGYRGGVFRLFSFLDDKFRIWWEKTERQIAAAATPPAPEQTAV